jgi:quercetin dioxygenase-like cupin family protein
MEDLIVVRGNEIMPVKDVCGMIYEGVRNENFSIATVKVEKRHKTNSHYHKKMAEAYLVNNGSGEFKARKVDSMAVENYKLKKGDQVSIPPRVIHQTHAYTDMELIVVNSPPFDRADIYEASIWKMQRA